MAEKKRKSSDSTTTAQAAKKAKKVPKPQSDKQILAKAVDLAALSGIDKAGPKRPRKRAADLLDDEPAAPPQKGKKSKINVSLTADGVNGVVEHSSDEDITIMTAAPAQKSMMAEAERTQDQELEDEFGDDVDAAPALLTGFDSDNDDPAEDKDVDTSRVQPIPQFKKTSKKLRKAKENKSDGPGVVFVGRIPHGFYESQMREYFSQFGTITKLRLSRNKKTGASKHFAFIEFDSDEVAKIVAETMDNYLMFGHILKCKYAPEGSLHDDVWKGANRKYRKLPHHKLSRERAEQPKTEEQIANKMTKEQRKREKQAEKLKAIGYEYELPELKKPQVDGAARVEADEQKAIEDRVEGAVVPPSSVPKDELAVKVEQDVKKSKKSKKGAKKEREPAEVEEAPVMERTAKKAKESAEELAAEVVPDQQPKTRKIKAKVEKGKTGPGKERLLKGILKKPDKA